MLDESRRPGRPLLDLPILHSSTCQFFTARPATSSRVRHLLHRPLILSAITVTTRRGVMAAARGSQGSGGAHGVPASRWIAWAARADHVEGSARRGGYEAGELGPVWDAAVGSLWRTRREAAGCCARRSRRSASRGDERVVGAGPFAGRRGGQRGPSPGGGRRNQAAGLAPGFGTRGGAPSAD